jgi:Ca2+/Na+ antiporter
MTHFEETYYKSMFFISIVFIVLGFLHFNYVEIWQSLGLIFVAIGGILLMRSFEYKDRWMGRH